MVTGDRQICRPAKLPPHKTVPSTLPKLGWYAGILRVAEDTGRAVRRRIKGGRANSRGGDVSDWREARAQEYAIAL